ncbi:Short C-terminal domain-containing protein [Halogranum gelatinilyticum]|uniref:Short C-terminal domain-containing protein n=1 Tax=Halogranum gelatinilyticum TaxID=660521 RepID=A0A1G9SNU1_9EURY|nr:SHOCT domain-containing protein [Halogranum gelatinilyticum]SDM37183.1 Short C-terminal domain-containing protein [Halogranum gelatinilyticum]
MDEQTPSERLRDNATEIASLLVTGFWLAALLTGQSWWLGALIVGYVVVVPIVSLLFGDSETERDWWDDLWDSNVVVGTTDEMDDEPDEVSETPLETLRRRYAAGELTDEQFERKLERLLETETLEDAEERVARERLREREL